MKRRTKDGTGQAFTASSSKSIFEWDILRVNGYIFSMLATATPLRSVM
jgi:hypothetical protein